MERNGIEENGKKRVRAAKAAVTADDALKDWCVWWNSLRTKRLVPCGVNEDEPSKAVRSAWKLVQQDRELRDFASQRDAIQRELRASSFVKEASWLRPEKLLRGKNRDGELIIRKLLEGGFRDSKPATVGAGQTYDAGSDFGDGF